ncbi:hypothetical protein SELMODRAFT_427596 [Selaginella moellendorffii]|uniref:PPM-type phosphatase domain-containing protein n=1 Tax=Selaginella moellendorffii TaxID=88036 RepID=D8T042_SELML|nr:hypothetical protein SELMODRAFT_427596 [Selaginella moellendorffii]
MKYPVDHILAMDNKWYLNKSLKKEISSVEFPPCSHSHQALAFNELVVAADLQDFQALRLETEGDVHKVKLLRLLLDTVRRALDRTSKSLTLSRHSHWPLKHHLVLNCFWLKHFNLRQPAVEQGKDDPCPHREEMVPMVELLPALAHESAARWGRPNESTKSSHKEEAKSIAEGGKSAREALEEVFTDMDAHLLAAGTDRGLAKTKMEFEEEIDWNDGEEEEEEKEAQQRSLVVASVGDSRAILSEKGRAVELARAHEPKDPKERSRIEAAGGKIMPNGSLSDVLEWCTLAMSQPIGKLKCCFRQADRDCCSGGCGDELTSDDDFLVLSSDGIWMEVIVDFVAS